MMDRDKLYNQIDRKEEMSDAEKRKAYFYKIQLERDREDFEDQNK